MGGLASAPRVVLLLLALAASASASAGAACSDTPPTPDSVRKGLVLALKTFQALDESQASIALIGRVGSDLSKHKLRYSHMGFVWRDHPRGRWSVVHMLNQCGTASSALYDEGLGNFFNDDPFAYESIVVFPGAAIQERLIRVLGTALPASLYHPSYNMVAYPWSTRYQNSNQWLLEVMAAALAPEGTVFTRRQAQDWLKQAGYQPTLLRLGPLERLGGRMFRANIAFDDHPNELRFSDQIYTVTVESVVDFVQRHDSAARVLVLAL
jgi:hypothetical protein